MPPIDSEDQELLDGFLAETTELLGKLDEDLITLDANQAFASQLNKTPEYFFGLNVFDFMPQEAGVLC